MSSKRTYLVYTKKRKIRNHSASICLLSASIRLLSFLASLTSCCHLSSTLPSYIPEK